MPQGLQVWNENGELVLDTTQRVVKYVTVDTVVEGVTENIPVSIDVTSSVVAVPVGTKDRNYTAEVSYSSGLATVSWGSGSDGLTRQILAVEF